jgi:hypothetical protein
MSMKDIPYIHQDQGFIDSIGSALNQKSLPWSPERSAPAPDESLRRRTSMPTVVGDVSGVNRPRVGDGMWSTPAAHADEQIK